MHKWIIKLKWKLRSIMMRSRYYAMLRAPAIVLEEYQLTYIPIPKVACTSLHSLCVDLLGFKLPKDAWKAGVFRGNRYDPYINQGLRDSAMTNVLAVANKQEYWCFSVTRNPYDRLVSCYIEKICKNTVHKDFVGGMSKHFMRFNTFYAHMPFKEFVDAICQISDYAADPHFRSQYLFITDKKRRLIPNFLCDFQRLNLLTSEITKRTGAKISMPHLLKSKREPWENYYTDELKQKVAKRYKLDFELLGYKA